MKIREIVVRIIDADGLSFSLGEGFRLGQELLLVEVVTDSGARGTGGTSTYGNGRELVESILSTYAPMLLGRDPFDTEGFWKRALGVIKLYAAPQAAAALDLALWDLIGTLAQQPVYRLLGGGRERIPVYGSLPHLPTVEEHVELIDAYRSERGLTAFKIHLSGRVRDDLRLVEELRERVGDETVLLADAVGHYDYTDALRVGRALESAGFEWFEMPMEDYLEEGYRKLSSTLEIPITTGEVTNATLFANANAIAGRGWSIVRGDVANWGGITQGRKLSALAEAFGLRCEFHSWGFAVNQFANLHAMLPCPTSRYFEWPIPPQPFEFGFAPVVVRDGFAAAPTLPGLGLVPDVDRLDRGEQFREVFARE
ncbi:mandelate racemase [Leucobacter sp. UCD-THU]|uniref:Mandelate racemase/muconate lactonizing enzyme family protein n=1 Tax=Leucobacter muris TaxID=1935379 RepID=A0ABX5QDW8_9MICO|nr:MULTISPECIES: mandelate racemase/muconate lactonizing enzyme family protein [Leucobacter]EYT52058.1 mandelate racemase [Leucobacter sp. UCD-THU]QAB17257.1 mandelate racemase/muconate lactonizing enzyme family protein [Leucobacter muris]